MPGTLRLAVDVGVGLGVAAWALASDAVPASRVASTAITPSRTTTAASPAASRRRDPRTPGVCESAPSGPRSINLTLDTSFEKRISARLESAEDGCSARPGQAGDGWMAAQLVQAAAAVRPDAADRDAQPGADLGIRHGRGLGQQDHQPLPAGGQGGESLA